MLSSPSREGSPSGGPHDARRAWGGNAASQHRQANRRLRMCESSSRQHNSLPRLPLPCNTFLTQISQLASDVEAKALVWGIPHVDSRPCRALEQ